MNIMNAAVIKQKPITAAFSYLHGVVTALNCRVSYINATATDIKKIAILIKSGVAPNMPRTV